MQNPIVAAESFGNKMLQDLSAKWKQNFDDFADIFRKQENRSGRVTPGFGRQFLTIYSRCEPPIAGLLGSKGVLVASWKVSRLLCCEIFECS